ncbi:MAG: ZIP family metal transporter [Gammaproteobacteria bacterium]
MNTTLLWIVGFTTLAGIASAAIAGLFLAASERVRARILPHLVSFATGALLGAALLALLPHAIEEAGPGRAHEIGIALASGIGLFFVLEKFVLWRHCHAEQWEGDHVHARAHASGVLVLVGDAFHNVLDGVLIAAAFLTDIKLGIVTAIAAMAHEIPQEVGDFAVLLHAGMSRARALVLNLATSLTSVVGAVLAYFALQPVLEYLPYALAVAAACFLYVAVADLIPGLHRRVDLRGSTVQFVLIGIGIAVIAVAEAQAH